MVNYKSLSLRSDSQLFLTLDFRQSQRQLAPWEIYPASEKILKEKYIHNKYRPLSIVCIRTLKKTIGVGTLREGSSSLGR